MAASKDAELQALIDGDERGDAEASVVLGQALRKVGRYDEARAAYERGDRRGHPEAAMSLGNMLSEVGDTAGARLAFERGIAAGSTMAALNLGLMLADMGEADDALRYLRIARDQHGDFEAHWAIGKLLEGKGDRMGAIESYRAGAATGHAPAAFALGEVLYDLGDNEGAKAAFQQADALGDERAKGLLEAFAREPDGAKAVELARQLVEQTKIVLGRHESIKNLVAQYQRNYEIAYHPSATPDARRAFMPIVEQASQYVRDALAQLRADQDRALSTGRDFVHHAQPDGFTDALNRLVAQGLIEQGESNIVTYGINFFGQSDWGSTPESFLQENARVAAFMREQGYK